MATPGDKLVSPPTTKGRGTRQRIMASAKELFARNGYAGVRVTDITDAAGLSPGAFYRYFKDRYDLTLELLRELTDEAYEFARTPADEAQPIHSVLETTRRYFTFYRDHQALFGVMVELSQTHEEIAEIWAASRRAFYTRISHSLARGAQTGTIRTDIDLEVAAEMLGSMTEFYAFQRFVLNGSALKDIDIDVAARTLAEVWMSGIRTPHATICS